MEKNNSSSYCGWGEEVPWKWQVFIVCASQASFRNYTSADKESACNAGDLGSIPGLGRSLERGHGNPLQYSCLENSMDRGAWTAIFHGVANSLGTTEEVRHSFIRHYSEPSLCQIQHPYIIILSRQQNPYWEEIRLRVSRRRKHGVRGLGTRDRKLASRGAGAGKGVNLGGGDSAFVCITSMHCTQYRLNFLLLFIVDFF